MLASRNLQQPNQMATTTKQIAGALQSDQLHSVLRYGGDTSAAADLGQQQPLTAATTESGAADSIETPWRQQFVFEESTTMPPHAIDRHHNAYTPLSSVRFDFVNNESRSGLPVDPMVNANNGGRVLAAGRIQPPLPGTEDSASAAKKSTSNKIRNALVIAAVLLLVLIGIAVVVWLVRQHTTTSAAPSAAAETPDAAAVLSDSNDAFALQQNKLPARYEEERNQYFDDNRMRMMPIENEQQEQQQQQYNEAENSTQVFGIAIPDPVPGETALETGVVKSADVGSGGPSVGGISVAEPRNVADDHKRHQPPASSWFGMPRREDQKRDIDTGVLNAEGDIAKIYDKGRGGGNSVLGGEQCAPYATVNTDAARFIGWAEQQPYDPAKDSSLDPNNHTRSMLSLYQDKMKETTGAAAGGADTAAKASDRFAIDGKGRSMYRDGSSLSTVTSAEQAARVADPHFESKEAQFEQGRARAKQIAAEASSAITGIYERKHRAAAGNVVAEAAQNNDDPNFSYFNMSTQAMLGNE